MGESKRRQANASKRAAEVTVPAGQPGFARQKLVHAEPSPQEINVLVDMFNRRHYAEMETLARAMTVRFPNQGIGWKAMGTALVQQGRNEEALAPLQKATELSQGDFQPYNNLGNALVKLGRLPEAETVYRTALELNPGFAEAHYNLGNTLQELGRLPESEASYRRALELKPDFVEVHNSLGDIFLELDRLSEAEASYRRVLQIRPDHAEAHYNLGNTLKKQGKLEDAAACFRSYLEIDPKDLMDARLLLAALDFEPMPSRASQAHLEAIYTKKADTWDQSLGPTQEYCGARLVAQALNSQPNKSEKLDILDAGCGTGQVGLLVRDLASLLDGVDMSPNMLKKAKEKKVYDNIFQDDLESFMQSNPNKYDAITCAATLIHFGDLSSVFSAAATCLRNDGLFVFTVFRNDSEQDGKEVVVAQWDGYAGSGCYAHGKNYVIRLAETAEFVVEMLNTEVHEYYGKDVPIMCFVVVLRRRPRLGGLSRSSAPRVLC